MRQNAYLESVSKQNFHGRVNTPSNRGGGTPLSTPQSHRSGSKFLAPPLYWRQTGITGVAVKAMAHLDVLSLCYKNPSKAQVPALARRWSSSPGSSHPAQQRRRQEVMYAPALVCWFVRHSSAGLCKNYSTDFYKKI